MRKIIIITLLIFTLLMARQLPQQEIRAAVTNWLLYVTADAREDAVIEKLEPYVSDGDTVAYIAHLKKGGFCVCGAKSYMLPVYFYCPWGSFEKVTPEDRKFMLDGIAYGVKRLEKEEPSLIEDKLIPEREKYWRQLSDGRIDEIMETMGFWDGPDSMSLASVPRWDNHQSWPFDSLTPHLHSDFCTNRTYDGCVAHAMSIILRYWEWPHTGLGVDSTTYHRKYSAVWVWRPLSFNPFKDTFDSTSCPWQSRLMWSSADGGKLMMRDRWDHGMIEKAKKQKSDDLTDAQETEFYETLDSMWEYDLADDDTIYKEIFDTVHYRWDLMPVDVSDIDEGDEKYAVSRLTYDCGISLHMNYGTSGSGASFSPSAYINHFRYDPDAEEIHGLSRCNGPDTCNCPDDWHDSTPDTCNCPEPDTCEGAKAVVEEIQWLRPIHMGQAPYVHHDWMVLGYNRLPIPDEMQFKSTLSTTGYPHYYPVWATFSSHIIYYSMVRKIAPKDTIRFVGSTSSGDNDGSPADPYYGIEDAIADSADIPSNATLIFKAGSDNTFSSSSIKIDFPVILKSYDAVIRHN